MIRSCSAAHGSPSSACGSTRPRCGSATPSGRSSPPVATVTSPSAAPGAAGVAPSSADWLSSPWCLGSSPRSPGSSNSGPTAPPTVAEAELQRAEASRLATRSGQQLSSRLDVALLLAVAAHRSDPSPETASALWNALAATVPSGPTAHGVLEGFLFPDVASLRSVAVNANGSRAVFAGTSGDSGRIVVTDVGSRQPLATLADRRRRDRADHARG